MKQNPKWVEFLREQFPLGTRIRLMEMKDPYAPVPPGTEGTLEHIDDACQFHMRWDNGRTLALVPGIDRFTVIPQPLQTLKLFMPLTVKTYESDEYGNVDNDPVELDNRTVFAYEDTIRSAILKERMPDEAERGLMKYYGKNDVVNDKVQSYTFTVERAQDQLMGVAECHVQGELTNEELELLKEDISGQASDGFGEGFEQRPIKTADGEIYVSLWNSNRSWNVMTQDEMEQAQDQRMVGMKFD